MHEHIAAENAHDISRAIATFHHPRYEVAPFGSVSDGAQAVHDLLARMFASFPDFHVDVPRVHHANEPVVVEFVMTGTHQGPFCRAPAYRTADRGAIGGDFRFRGRPADV